MASSERRRVGCTLQQNARVFCSPDLDETNKKVRKYDRPKHQQSDVSTEVECKTGPQHEQHEAQKRISLLPPADEQTSPKRHDDASCNWAKQWTKVQNTTADHSSGNGSRNPELTVRILHAAPFCVVNSNQRL